MFMVGNTSELVVNVQLWEGVYKLNAYDLKDTILDDLNIFSPSRDMVHFPSLSEFYPPEQVAALRHVDVYLSSDN